MALPSKPLRSSRHGYSAEWTVCVILVAVVVASLLLATSGCQPLRINRISDRLVASNYRDWSPEFSRLPWATPLEEGRVRISNIRNNIYLSETDFVPQYYDREFALSEVETVDFIVVPFQTAPFMAHTMVSFGLSDGTWFSISAEIRTEKGETYSPVLGLSRQFEITYVIADERDIIRLRTRHRKADVYLYRTTATPVQAQSLLVSMLERANALAARPEFYNTLANNCTTNVLDHVNQLRTNKLAFNWQVLMPGYSDRYAWEQGLLDRTVPFEDLRRESLINDLAEQYYDDPQFSRRIRERIRPLN